MAAVCRDSARYAGLFHREKDRRKVERERETSSIFEAVIQNEGGRDGGTPNNPSTFFEDNPLSFSSSSSRWYSDRKQTPPVCFACLHQSRRGLETRGRRGRISRKLRFDAVTTSIVKAGTAYFPPAQHSHSHKRQRRLLLKFENTTFRYFVNENGPSITNNSVVDDRR